MRASCAPKYLADVQTIVINAAWRYRKDSTPHPEDEDEPSPCPRQETIKEFTKWKREISAEIATLGRQYSHTNIRRMHLL